MRDAKSAGIERERVRGGATRASFDHRTSGCALLRAPSEFAWLNFPELITSGRVSILRNGEANV